MNVLHLLITVGRLCGKIYGEAKVQTLVPNRRWMCVLYPKRMTALFSQILIGMVLKIIVVGAREATQWIRSLM